ncbi:MAG: thioredoxin family protein [Bacteroidia bacterium]|nr:thioredoxin family protein [Bacteroidia bacterium]
MKTLITLLFSLLVLHTNAQDENEGMDFFEGSWEDAIYKANAYNKFIFVDAYATWCGPCKKMQSDIFPQKDVGDFYNANFVNMKVDMEKGWGIDFAKNHKVRFYPSYLFFDAAGNLIHRSGSYKKADKFIKDGVNALDPNMQYSNMHSKYEKGNRDPQFLYDYAKASFSAGGSYKDISKEYFKTQKEEDLISEQNWKFIHLFTTDINSTEYKYLMDNNKKFAEKYGAEKINEKLTTTAVRSVRQAAMDKDEEMFKQIKGIIKKYDEADRVNERLSYSDMTYYNMTEDWGKYAAASSKYVQKFASDNQHMLNMIAWNFYENIDDKGMLAKAEGWIKKSIEIEKSYANVDTYAAVLYKLGKKEEALKAVDEALSLAKDEEIEAKETQELKEKIEKL